MAYSVQIACPGAPRAEVLEAAIEALVAANTVWYLEQLERGVEPPCCAECGGVKYRPGDPGTRAELHGAPQCFARGIASCEEAAAIEAGRGRALAILGGASYRQAAALHYVELGDGYHPKQRPGEPYWHAYYVSPAGRKDATTEMERA